MNNLTILSETEFQKILSKAINSKIPVIMSYLSRRKWHVAKLMITDAGVRTFSAVSMHPQLRYRPINVKMNHPVGFSIKFGYGKFIFDTTVAGFELSSNPSGQGTIVFMMPEKITFLQRRCYFRVRVPDSLKVNVAVWHRSTKNKNQQTEHTYYAGRLADISAGGAQIILANKTGTSDDSGENTDTAQPVPDFRTGQFIGVRLTPLPYEKPLTFNAQIRNILPTADNSYLCLGLQIVGLEASDQGREILSRLTEIIDRYHQINQFGPKQQDMSPDSLRENR